ncbi:F-box/kelch-repeat protein SKIP11 [Dichanthelium oligosanthes]|uniref:F-box/kelch-repeat protein SKIP11 n=1 Tax=Dichanthelium oligosanthes TaxID=888268 RepID=A0A1E5UZF7_9POAL|nr:F-box/kelch-repeat protein SKIP11 [Dichanthelium oligosanthes]
MRSSAKVRCVRRVRGGVLPFLMLDRFIAVLAGERGFALLGSEQDARCKSREEEEGDQAARFLFLPRPILLRTRGEDGFLRQERGHGAARRGLLPRNASLSIGCTSPAMLWSGMHMTPTASAGSRCPRCRQTSASCARTRNLWLWAMAHIVFRYSILTNSWTRGDVMNSLRCLFGSASVGEKAYVAGGTDSLGRVLSSAELYNCETHTWTTLPSMNRARKNCSGVFMDGKFYVISGVTNNNVILTWGEEYDVQSKSWRVIENMSGGLSGGTGVPPLISVVKNELYAADYSEKDVKKYDKQNNKWITLGKLSERSVSMNGWGLAFRACGERLIVIGGSRTSVGCMIELNSWIPDDKPPVWNLIARRPSGNFVYNCAVMGC